MSFWDGYKQSRRQFIGQSTRLLGAGCVVEVLDQRPLLAAPDIDNSDQVQTLNPGPNWAPNPGMALHRFDGWMKVTGKKIYGRDLRAQDLYGWPKDDIRVVILRVHRADRIFMGVDHERLKKDLKVVKIVTCLDLDKNHIKIPFYFGRIMMARPGMVPDYLGQPAALLYIRSEDAIALGPQLVDLNRFTLYGAVKPRVKPESYGYTRLVRYGEFPNKNPNRDLFSAFQDGLSTPPWEAPDPKGSSNARCVYFAERIAKEIQDPTWNVVEGLFSTQSIDPCFMESESGLSWYDPKSHTLHLTLGTQSPYEDGDACGAMFSDGACPIKIKKVRVNCCYLGGGFGGRDHSDFPLYLALAAAFAPGKTARMVFNRFEQFQAGIKRHPARIVEKLAFDSEGRMQALVAQITLDGGGQNNYSFAVQAVAAQNATAAYYIPRTDIESQALSSVGVTSGSMRGFGTLQAMFALESLVDEAALKLKMDPMELRLKNLLTKQKNTTMGGRPTFEIQSEKILRQAQSSKIWNEREVRRQERSTATHLYGVGFALAVKSYGTHLDACLAAVEIARTGEILVKSNGVDMGNGIATTLPLSVADILGRNALHFKGGVTEEFKALELTSSFEKDQAGEDQKAKNPRWVPYISMSQAASAGAYQMRHAVREAAQILLEYSIWPAAATIAKLTDRRFIQERIQWDQGRLRIDNRHHIDWSSLLEFIYKEGLITGSMVHTYYRAQWSKAEFTISYRPATFAIDALALRKGSAKNYHLLDRKKVEFPPFLNQRLGVDMFTPYGLIVAVQVERQTGIVTVTEAHGFIDVGQMGQYDIVEGQAQGALAMGIGQALYEDLPVAEGGPGEGGWNFGRYRVPTMRDVPLQDFHLHVIDPVPGDPPKGMAEVVECAVPPAISNAITHATGHRFTQLPLTPESIKEKIG